MSLSPFRDSSGKDSGKVQEIIRYVPDLSPGYSGSFREMDRFRYSHEPKQARGVLMRGTGDPFENISFKEI